MKKKRLAVAVATALSAGSASAASEWKLVNLRTISQGGTAALALSGVLTFSEGPGNSLNSDGTFSAAGRVGMTPLFTWQFGSDFAISGAGTTSGSFTCTEGIFGGVVGASICGNYNFGANGYNESIVNADGSNRVIGGDDVGVGPAQSISDFSGLSPRIPPTDFVTTIELRAGTGSSSGQIWQFEANTAIPVPAAAWLFGSALGFLGWLRRKRV